MKIAGHWGISQFEPAYASLKHARQSSSPTGHGFCSGAPRPWRLGSSWWKGLETTGASTSVGPSALINQRVTAIESCSLLKDHESITWFQQCYHCKDSCKSTPYHNVGMLRPFCAFHMRAIHADSVKVKTKLKIPVNRSKSHTSSYAKFWRCFKLCQKLGLSISIDRKPCTRPCPSRYPPWAVHHKGCCHLSNDHHASGSSQIQCRDRCSHHPTCRTWTNPRKWSGQDWQVRSQQFFPDSVDIAHLNSAKNRRFWTLWPSKPNHQFRPRGILASHGVAIVVDLLTSKICLWSKDPQVHHDLGWLVGNGWTPSIVSSHHPAIDEPGDLVWKPLESWDHQPLIPMQCFSWFGSVIVGCCWLPCKGSSTRTGPQSFCFIFSCSRNTSYRTLARPFSWISYAYLNQESVGVEFFSCVAFGERSCRGKHRQLLFLHVSRTFSILYTDQLELRQLRSITMPSTNLSRSLIDRCVKTWGPSCASWTISEFKEGYFRAELPEQVVSLAEAIRVLHQSVLSALSTLVVTEFFRSPVTCHICHGFRMFRRMREWPRNGHLQCCNRQVMGYYIIGFPVVAAKWSWQTNF